MISARGRFEDDNPYASPAPAVELAAEAVDDLTPEVATALRRRYLPRETTLVALAIWRLLAIPLLLAVGWYYAGPFAAAPLGARYYAPVIGLAFYALATGFAQFKLMGFAWQWQTGEWCVALLVALGPAAFAEEGRSGAVLFWVMMSAVGYGTLLYLSLTTATRVVGSAAHARLREATGQLDISGWIALKVVLLAPLYWSAYGAMGLAYLYLFKR